MVFFGKASVRALGLLIFIIVSKRLLMILQRTDKYMAELGVTKRGIHK